MGPRKLQVVRRHMLLLLTPKNERDLCRVMISNENSKNFFVSGKEFRFIDMPRKRGGIVTVRFGSGVFVHRRMRKPKTSHIDRFHRNALITLSNSCDSSG